MTAAELRDGLDVRDRLYAYAQGVDRKDLALVAACFTSDCAYEGSLGRGTIADALPRLAAAFDRYDRTMHFMGTQDVRLAGDDATAETSCVAYHVRPNGVHVTVGVRYLDELVRTKDGWRLRRRVARIEWTREDRPARPT